MLWTRALKTLFKNPLYLVMTLLPVLLVALLAFPVTQSLTGTLDTIYESIAQPQFFENYNPYAYSYELPEEILESLFSALLPILGSLLLVMAVGLLSTLLITPISLQYLGDATRLGYVPAGFAGRGLKRLWWKPFIFSLILSTGMNVLSSAATTPMTSSFGLMFMTEDVSPMLLLFGITMIVFIFISLYLSITTYMFYGSIAMEDGSFGYSMGRGFARGIKRFFPMWGASLVMGLIGGLIMGGIVAGYIFSSMDTFKALEYATSFEEIAAFLGKFLNDLCILICISAVITWFINAFITSYAFQQTLHQMEREQAKRVQPVYSSYTPPMNGWQQPQYQQPEPQPQQSDVWQQPEPQPQQSDVWQQPEPQPQQSDIWQQSEPQPQQSDVWQQSEPQPPQSDIWQQSETPAEPQPMQDEASHENSEDTTLN